MNSKRISILCNMLDFNAYLCRKLSKQSSIYPGLLSLSTAENKNLKLISIILSNNFLCLYYNDL